jgi:hypothetical protein
MKQIKCIVLELDLNRYDYTFRMLPDVIPEELTRIIKYAKRVKEDDNLLLEPFTGC